MFDSSIREAGGFRNFVVGVVSLVAVIICAASPSYGQGSINTDFKNSVAIGGYDPVAYFALGRAVKGSDDFSYQWMGADWHFSSADHRELFAGNPVKYAPQYGGHCSWAVSQGYTHTIDPESWSIIDGKLYLNYSKTVQSWWKKDVVGNISKADANWPEIQAKLVAQAPSDR